MAPVHFNYPAIFTAAALCFLIGGAWYSPLLFARAWLREAALDEKRIESTPLPLVFGLSFLCALVMAFNLAAFLGDKASLSFRAFAGPTTGLGWVSMSLAVIYLFERRPFKLRLIHAGYQVVAYPVMGAVIGAWK